MRKSCFFSSRHCGDEGFAVGVGAAAGGQRSLVVGKWFSLSMIRGYYITFMAHGAFLNLPCQKQEQVLVHFSLAWERIQIMWEIARDKRVKSGCDPFSVARSSGNVHLLFSNPDPGVKVRDRTWSKHRRKRVPVCDHRLVHAFHPGGSRHSRPAATRQTLLTSVHLDSSRITLHCRRNCAVACCKHRAAIAAVTTDIKHTEGRHCWPPLN